MADDFCKEFAKVQEKHMVEARNHKHRNKPNPDERCGNHGHLDSVPLGKFPMFQALLQGICLQALTHLFPRRVPYNRLAELEKEVLLQLTVFIKKVLLGTCTDNISFVVSTPLCVCRRQRILIHKTFEGLAECEKCSMGGSLALSCI